VVSENRIEDHSMNMLNAVATYRESTGIVGFPALYSLEK
jgi:hypothetical protein